VLVVCNAALQATVAPFGPTPRSLFWMVWSMLESAGWACFILAWVSFERKLPAGLDNALNHGGQISFSFYLLHMAVLHVLAQYIVSVRSLTGIALADAGIAFVVAYGATWALATLSYWTIEEPFLRMRRGYGNTRSAPLAKAA